MPSNVLRLSLILCALMALAPAAAGAKTTVRAVSAPRSVAAGGRLALKVTVRNAARRTAKPAKLRALLSADRRRDARDVALAGEVRAPRLAAHRSRTLKAKLTVPASVRAGRYHLVVCAARCKVLAGTVAVRARPVPQPAPSPAPQPTATPAPTSTPAPAGGGEEPDPAPLPQGVPTGFGDSVAFLYEGKDKVQTGVQPGTIKAARVAVLRGTVHDKDGQGLGGVKVTVLDHPELGQTVTRADGGYDLAVNGGGPTTLTFARDGYITAQREVTAPWQDFAVVDDVILLAYDPRVTRVNLAGDTAQVATGSPVTDADGTRQASVLFPAGTQAQMVMPDGTTKPLSTLDVRATEFTAGASGPEAMPGSLPPSSAYTYAVELSVDQAVAAGATEVRFDRPVVNYVDNFLHFPVGGAVPTGYYDRAAGEWKAAPNGRIIKVLAIADGKALLDTDGDGEADDGLGIDDAERARLAATRHVGDELWRVPMTHFTPWDHNWPYAPPPDAEPPRVPEPRVDVPTNRRQSDCNKHGSIIGCQGQTLAEELPVTGTPLKLRYDTRRSDRRTDRSMEIPLTGHSIPASLESVRLEVDIAGRTETKTFAPKKDLVYEYVWDRKDAYGREVQGRVPVTLKIGYVYGLIQYANVSGFNDAFGKFSNTPEDTIGNPRTLGSKYVSLRIVHDEFGVALGSLDAQGTGLGGWELSVHHAYDARMHTLYRGDGLQVSADPVLDTLAGTGDAGDPRDADVAPDGSVWVANAATDQVIRFDQDGHGEVMAGSTGGGDCDNCRKRLAPDDDPLATSFSFSRPMSVALAPDGSFYVADYLVDWGLQQGVVYKVDPGGHIRRVAGCFCTEEGDGGPATDAAMTPLDLAVGPDGTLYIADYRNARIRAVDAGGTIRTVAGGGADDDGGYADGIPGTRAHLWEPQSVEAAGDGSVYFGDDGRGGRVRRLAPDGTVTTIAGGHYFNEDNGDGGPATDANIGNPQGLAYGADGSLYITDFDRIRRVQLDGTIVTVAGGGPDGATGASRVAAGSVHFPGAAGLDVAPDGSMYVASVAGLSRISRQFPVNHDGELAIPSKDGREVYFFNRLGRHLRTVDGLSGAVLWRFAYDDAGRLTSLTDADGRVTRIERAGDGHPTAIVAPGGQRTELAVEGDHLVDVKDPAGKSTHLGYDGTGRLATLVDRRGGHHAFDYDEDGRLIRDEDPTGRAQTLSRKELANGYAVTLTSPEGRKTTWETGNRPNGDGYLETTSPSGAKTVSSVGIDGVSHLSSPDGQTVDFTQGPDPRWGFYVPVTTSIAVHAPSGRTQTTTARREVDLADVTDPLSVQSITDTFTTNGRTSVFAYDAATRRETATTPEGRVTATTYDARDRVVRVDQGPGLDPIAYTYDDDGFLRRAAQGDESYRFEPDARGRVAAQIDAAGHRTEFTYDDDDRVVAVKRPGGGTERYEYDAEGARTAVILPGGKRHGLGRDARGALSAYEPVAGSAFTREHNADGQLTAEGAATFAYEQAGGRATGASWDDAGVAYGYDGALDRPSSLTWTPAGGGTAEGIAYTFDGAQTTGLTLSGTAQGVYTFGYDGNGWLTSTKLVSGAQTVASAIARDKDGRMTGDGPFTIARGGPNGAVSAITGGGLDEAVERDGHGRLKARTLKVGAGQRYRLELTYGDDGTIARRVETVDGTAHTYDYHYDDDGQLTGVDRDGTAIERYGYDAGGNRKTRQLGTGALETSAFDDEDRLTSRGDTTYEYDAAGFLTRRGGDTFHYDARGELLSATVGGTSVSYRYDAMGRRVARIQGGQVTQYLYGDPGNALRVTATRSPAGVLTTYRYDEDGLLYALERGGQRFFVGTDQVGTPRVVTNSSGAVVDVREYGAFGEELSDSQPAFDLPLGYAGGLEDRVTGLVRFGFRDLDTASGRWTARDPALYEGGQANLYAYVSNNPIALRDPTGLWCVGGSVYEGVGGGATICHTDEGTAVCFEVGFGIGVAGEVLAPGKILSPGVDNGGLPPDGESIVAEAKAAIPGFGVGVSLELNNCGDLTPGGSVDAGVFNVNLADGTTQVEMPVYEEGASVKLAAKVCRRV